MSANEQMSSGCEAMLGRIRRALQVPAPKRIPHESAPATDRYAKSLPVIRPEARAWLPPVGETWDEQLQLFIG